MFRISAYIFASVLLIAVLLIPACSDDDETIYIGAGQLIDYSGCKFVETDILNKSVYAPSYQDCIEYDYDSTGTLILTHVNAAFNCCPDDITADIQISGNTITITEDETNGVCDCDCLYDVEYQFIAVEPVTVTVIINGIYRGYIPPVEVTLDLANNTFGAFCFERDVYPWRN